LSCRGFSVLDGENFRVAVHDRVVTLRGTVNASWKMHIVENALSNLKGIERIDNLLAQA
jgi:osmotically-inducible protein OsmY